MRGFENEIWKDVVGFEGLYEVSNFGRIKGLEKKCNGRWVGHTFRRFERIMKQNILPCGYVHIGLKKNKKQYSKTIHSLVWDAFIGNPPKKESTYQIDHIDGNKNNNRLDNLQLLTHRENTAKSVKKEGKLTGAFKNGNKWIARVSVNNRLKSLGNYDTQELAHEAYCKFIKSI